LNRRYTPWVGYTHLFSTERTVARRQKPTMCLALDLFKDGLSTSVIENVGVTAT
jgi:hypothetical protein